MMGEGLLKTLSGDIPTAWPRVFCVCACLHSWMNVCERVCVSICRHECVCMCV